MKLNDIVTWTGRNGEKRFGLIVASDGNGDTKSLLVGVDEKRGEYDE